MNKLTRDEVATRIDEIADFADIGDFINQPVKNYSSGMFVRLAFAVAVYSDPDILIVDEALAVGDAAFQAKCMARMNQIMKSGATVLFVTHDMNTVKRLCQRCIYLENGVKIMEGPAEELADIYLKKIRASMNEEHLKIETDNLNTAENFIDTNQEGKSIEIDKASLENYDFMKKTKKFKEGNGDVEFIDLKICNQDNEECVSFSFDSIIRIKIRLKVNCDRTFGIAYHIRDDKNTELLGGSTKKELGYLFDAKEGEYYEIMFETRLPIIEGNYNITLIASSPVIENRTALFLDYIENAGVFMVEEAEDYKLWDKVYIKNKVNVNKF